MVAGARLVSAREEMLGAIRSALGPNPEAPEVPRGYRGRAGTTPDAVALFCERVADYRAAVHRVRDDAALAETLGELCTGRVLRAPGVEWEADADSPRLSARDLDSVDAALTGCALAIAETGTIVLDGSLLCGRRALTLVPDHHVCVVRTDQVVTNLPDAIDQLGAAARAGRPLTFISGPSATSDIELQRVEGVHGPRKLDVVVLG
jgi:L-lactate dehydrogenase complex protein LldG